MLRRSVQAIIKGFDKGKADLGGEGNRKISCKKPVSVFMFALIVDLCDKNLYNHLLSN